jgi:hypothetical protein
MDDLIAFMKKMLADEEAVARAASGGTVTGGPGNWKTAPGGDEWEVYADLVDGDYGQDGDLGVLVALRPGLPRPPEVMSGYWGQVIGWKADRQQPGTRAPEPQFRHMAMHDPASALRGIAADRRLLGEYEEAAENRGGGEWTDSSAGHADGMEAGLLLAVQVRAERFAGHPEYRAEWAVI